MNLSMLRVPSMKLPVLSQNYIDFDLHAASAVMSSSKNPSSSSNNKWRSKTKSRIKNIFLIIIL